MWRTSSSAILSYYNAISGIIFLVMVVVGWALLVALYLASWGSQNYRVVIK